MIRKIIQRGDCLRDNHGSEDPFANGYLRQDSPRSQSGAWFFSVPESVPVLPWQNIQEYSSVRAARKRSLSSVGGPLCGILLGHNRVHVTAAAEHDRHKISGKYFHWYSSREIPMISNKAANTAQNPESPSRQRPAIRKRNRQRQHSKK